MECTGCELGHSLVDADQAHFCAWCGSRPPKDICLAIHLDERRLHPFLTSSDELMVRSHRAALLSNDVASTLFKWSPTHKGFFSLPTT